MDEEVRKELKNVFICLERASECVERLLHAVKDLQDRTLRLERIDKPTFDHLPDDIRKMVDGSD